MGFESHLNWPFSFHKNEEKWIIPEHITLIHSNSRKPTITESGKMPSMIKCAWVLLVASIWGLMDVALTLYIFIADDLPRKSWILKETLWLSFYRGFLAKVTNSFSFRDIQPVLKLLWTSAVRGTTVKNLEIPRDKNLQTNGLSYSAAALRSGISCKLITPKSSKGNKIVLYLHGGFFVVGSVDMFLREASNLADLTGYTVLAVGYGLSPEHPFPEPLHDVISVFSHITKNMGFRPQDVGFYGVASGGNLAISASIWLRDHDLPMPKAISVMSPMLDFSDAAPSKFVNAHVDILPRLWTTAKDRHDGVFSYYVQKNRTDDPYISPVYATASSVPLPPILIQVGASEALRDEAFFFALNIDQSAKDKSLPPNRISVEIYTDCIHDWPYTLPGKKLSNLAGRRVVHFLEDRLREREVARRDSDVSDGASEFLIVHIKVAVEKVPQDAAKIVLSKGFEDIKSKPELVEGTRFDWKTARKLWKIPPGFEKIESKEEEKISGKVKSN
jgi:monoterpene epsilon-lactone hydrolase